MVFFDGCGIWKSGACPKSYFLMDSDMNLKSVKFVKGKYVRDKQVGKQRFLEELSPQPTNVVTLCRYYRELKRDSEYKRRVSWIESNDNQRHLALVEYQGIYPKTTSSHGNATIHKKDDAYVRTKPEILNNISEQSKHKQTPRQIYKDMVMNDSIEAPRDFKQVRNVRYQNSQKEKERKGYKNNLADEILECISAVDTHDFVQHWSKSVGCLTLSVTRATNVTI